VVERFFSVEDGADCFCSQILGGRQVDNFCEPVDCYDVFFVDLRVFLFKLPDSRNCSFVAMRSWKPVIPRVLRGLMMLAMRVLRLARQKYQ